MYYSPKTGLFSSIVQIAACVGIAIFMGWLYMKTGNLWSVILVHFLQNNIGVSVFGTAPTNVVLGIFDVVVAVILYLLIYLPFLKTKEYKEN